MLWLLLVIPAVLPMPQYLVSTLYITDHDLIPDMPWESLRLMILRLFAADVACHCLTIRHYCHCATMASGLRRSDRLDDSPVVSGRTFVRDLRQFLVCSVSRWSFNAYSEEIEFWTCLGTSDIWLCKIVSDSDPMMSPWEIGFAWLLWHSDEVGIGTATALVKNKAWNEKTEIRSDSDWSSLPLQSVWCLAGFVWRIALSSKNAKSKLDLVVSMVANGRYRFKSHVGGAVLQLRRPNSWIDICPWLASTTRQTRKHDKRGRFTRCRNISMLLEESCLCCLGSQRERKCKESKHKESESKF